MNPVCFGGLADHKIVTCKRGLIVTKPEGLWDYIRILSKI